MNTEEMGVFVGNYKVYEVGANGVLTSIGKTSADGVTVSLESKKTVVPDGYQGASLEEFNYITGAFAEFKLVEYDGDALKRAVLGSTGTKGATVGVASGPVRMRSRSKDYVLKPAFNETKEELHIYLWQAVNYEDISLAFKSDEATVIPFKLKSLGRYDVDTGRYQYLNFGKQA